MAQDAHYLSHSDDARFFEDLANRITTALHTATFNASDAVYGCGSQGLLALALDMDAPPTEEIFAQVPDNFVESIKNNTNHWTVGEIALPAFFRVLHSNGYDELLYSLMNQTTEPSYGYEVVSGATSPWKAWDGTSTSGSSTNHLMFGYGDVQLSQLSGMQQVNSSVAWESINYYPTLVGNLTAASASHLTPRERASAAWKYVFLPAKENGTVIKPFDGLYSPVFVGSGNHSFTVT
ncbi:Alpha-L-rhamnosidase [Penicillium odoratum]|uniref:Alpha-L-rhamnosidase n=1 Tax=Penicillium odoratum TaxID=1167516 RepID=UPI002546BA78|nr:Alpha-L-rhamnosidase [Penicillium odoratum]KAJ5745103.1 Alpha-L-rhamnosidase [Penicillium odoratum]